jgi:competence protein ComEC
MGAGAALWFLAPQTPSFAVIGWGGGAAALFWAWARFFPQRVVRPVRDWGLVWAGRFLALLALAAAGAAAGALRTERAVAPRLAAEIGPAALEGWVVEIEPGARRPRMRILVAALEGVEALPRYVRVSAPSTLSPGRAISCRVVLSPPEPLLTPTGFDAERRAFFEQVGGSGFALGHCRSIARAPPSDWRDRLFLRVAAMRRDLAEAVAAAAPGRGGETAAALIAGDESLMQTDDRAALRDSGLGHLLSVSGLHMSLVAGIVFWALRRVLALAPGLALWTNTRKLAAAGAIITTAVYLVMSGASVPALRAFIMTATALGALLVDRPAITMRALAFAAAIIVALTPEAVLEPGFQMSFAATAALVAVFETTLGRRAHDALPVPGPIVGGLQAIWAGLAGSLAASLVAGLAIDAFAIHHFQRLTPYALPANLAASPIVTFLVAPAAAVAGVLAPFGLAEPPLRIMAWGLELIIGVGEAFAARPEAVAPMPASNGGALALATMAILWATLWRGALRLGAAAWAVLAVATYLGAAQPIVWASPDLNVVLMRVEGGQWRRAAPERGGAFVSSRLTAAAGLRPERALAPPERLEPPPARAPHDADMQAEPPDPVQGSGRALPTPPSLAYAWRTPGGRELALAPGAMLWSRSGDPGVTLRADPNAPGVQILESGSGLSIRRARPSGFDRPWAGRPQTVTPRRAGASSDNLDSALRPDSPSDRQSDPTSTLVNAPKESRDSDEPG